MKSRKYPSFNDAIADLESKGTLTYWGWEGQTNGYYIYEYIIEGVLYKLKIFKMVELKLGISMRPPFH